MENGGGRENGGGEVGFQRLRGRTSSSSSSLGAKMAYAKYLLVQVTLEPVIFAYLFSYGMQTILAQVNNNRMCSKKKLVQ